MLKCEHLVKKYITTTAISDLSLEIEPGHIYALLGPNGSGKSTLMKIIAGLVKPDSGTITIDGVPMTYRSKKDIAYMPTEAFFFGYMNCKDIGKYYKDFFDDFDYDKIQERLKQSKIKYGILPYWYIMTSKQNDDKTKSFFEEHNFFGYDKEKVKFFKQNVLPQLTLERKISFRKWNYKNSF